ncbi:MAG: AAA family ATPase [Planctomycetes bacterium]|nr:AAA family ATPase [Planctomycetota bacterium]NOG53105.1 AAA family ATPase [Planctomycetota bacterium]
MENVRSKIVSQIQHMVRHAVVRDRRFLDDEQLIRSEQLEVLEEIFNANVRDTEIRELSSHFAPVLRGDHPCHLAVWGKTGTGKTLTCLYFLNLLAEMCKGKDIQIRHEHLDLSTPRPCFRALNDLACLLGASRRVKKGISLEELMVRIEASLARYKGIFVLFVDECDHVRRDRDTFMTFLVRRLPQQIPSKLILVLTSNRLDWPDQLDPRVKSFLKINELIFKPYDAVDLQQILGIRADKALLPGILAAGVIEKIAGLASRDHGDARKAVALLAKSAYLAEKAGTSITMALVDQAVSELDQDRYLSLLRTAPRQLQAAMAAVIHATNGSDSTVGTGEAYDSYRSFCTRTDLPPLTGRAFGDLLNELDTYSLIRTRILSRGRYGRSRQITLDLPENVITRISETLDQNAGLPR